MDENVMVSVCCITYNQERYIRDALDGFVMQKTDFPFEILIHDDASTDSTPEILREYEAKYPELIRVIYQTENQYSQDVHIFDKFLFPNCKGKYIALCEGDDYWIDPLKLQKQYDAMEQHPELDMCAHTGKKVVANTKELIGYVAPRSEDCVICTADVIRGCGGFVVTNSLFFRRCITENLPRFRQMLEMDITLQIHGALRGGMLYLKDCMSVYRAAADGSWSLRREEQSREELKDYLYNKRNPMYQALDEETHYQYSDIIHFLMLEGEFSLGATDKEKLSKKYRTVWRTRSLKERTIIIMKAYFPKAFQWLRTIKASLTK